MDNNENQGSNQSETIFGDGPVRQARTAVEEVSPQVENPEDILSSSPPNYPTDVPIYEEKSNKGIFIIGILLFFIIVFGLVYWFFLKDKFSGAPINPTVTENKEVVLKYWGLWEEKATMDPLINEYQKQNPNVKIDYENISIQQYRDRLIARSKTGNGPDIFRFHNTWLPEIQEVISPLPKDVMTNEEYETTFYPVIQKDMKVGEDYYGIPLYIDGTVLVYNDTIFKQAGLISPPVSWIGGGNDVVSTVNKLSVKNASGEIITSGFAIGTATNVEHFGELLGILTLLNGGDLKNLSSTEATEALQLYRKFSEDGYWNETMPNSISAFIEGKVAMIVVPSWEIINIKAKNPDLNIKVAEIPQGLDGSEAAISNYWVEGVNKLSKNQAESWKFLKYLSQKKQLQKLFEEQSKVRLFGNAYPRKDMADLLIDHPYLGPIISQAKKDVYVSWPVISKTFDGGLNDENLQYLENAITSTSQGTDYQSALVTASRGINSVLERYKIE